jgi:glycosyltransferase involved in cell wall biosynthesis
MTAQRRLKITFLSPVANMGGGTRVSVIQAQGLARLGHEVTFVSPPPPRPTLRDRLRALRHLRPQPNYVRTPISHLDGSGIEHIILDRHRPPEDRDVPDGDVVIATWWETAEWAMRLSRSKGAKAYFVQHHELFEGLPHERVRATYRMPLHKITIAQWLTDLMRIEYGDADCTLAPNSVDHDQFHAPPRALCTAPTVGVLYAETPIKGVPTALEAIRQAQLQMQAPILVHTFMSYPYDGLPDDIHFASVRVNPPQDTLRDIYASCDVWLTASISEGFNLPAMEAMACRTPVVATRTGWPAEAIRDGWNGFLCDVGNVEQLSSGLIKVLKQTPLQWQAMSNSAWDTVKDSSWTVSVACFEAGLLRAIERTSRGEL